MLNYKDKSNLLNIFKHKYAFREIKYFTTYSNRFYWRFKYKCDALKVVYTFKEKIKYILNFPFCSGKDEIEENLI